MGFFAGELAAILQAHAAPDADPWAILRHMGVDDAHIVHLKRAADEIAQVGTLPSGIQQQLQVGLQLSPSEWARLQAANDADTFLRLMLYHRTPLSEAVDKANAIFAAALKDKLATGDANASVYPTLTERDQAGIHPGPQHHRPRGPRRKDAIEF